MSRSFDDDLGLKVGGNVSQAFVEELRRLRKELTDTIEVARRLNTVTGAGSRRAAGASGAAARRAAGDESARAAARAARDEERAWISSIRRVDQQRRESERIARALYRDQEREARRVAAVEARAARDVSREKIAAERAELRALRDFGNAMRRETRDRYADQERAAKNYSAAQKRYYNDQLQSQRAASLKSAQSEAELWNLLGGFIQKAAQYAARFAAIVGAITVTAIVAGMSLLVERGLAFNSTLESAQLGIGSLIASFYEVRDASGRTLEGGEKLAASIEIAGGEMQKLRIAGLQTVLTTEELVATYQQAIGAAASAKVPLSEVLGLTIKIAQAGAAIGLEGRQMNEEVRSLLSGNITLNSRIAQSLGITGAMVKDWKTQGTLVEELNKRLELFGLTGALTAKTFAGLTSNLREAFDVLAGAATSQLFDELKGTFGDILDRVFDLKEGELRPDIQKIVDLFDDAFGEAGRRIRGYVDSILDQLVVVGHWIDNNRQTVLEIVDAAFALGEQLAGLIIDTAQLAVEGEVTVKGYRDAGGAAAELRDIVRAIGLAVAATRDVASDIPNLIKGAGGLLRLAIVLPLQSILKGAGRLVDLFVNLTTAIKSTGAALAEAAEAVTSGDFTRAITAFQSIALPTNLGARTAQGAAIADALDNYVREGRDLLGRFNRVGSGYYTDQFKKSALGDGVIRAGGRASFGGGYSTSPGGAAADAAKNAGAAAAQAQKFDDAIDRINEDVARMREELGLSAETFKDFSEQFNRFVQLPGKKQFPADPRAADPSEFLKIAGAAGDQLRLSGLGRNSFLGDARALAQAAEDAIKTYSEGVTRATKNGIEVLRPSADQIAKFTQATRDKLTGEYLKLIQASNEKLDDVDAKIRQYREAVGGGADTAAKQWAKLQDEIREVEKIIDDSVLGGTSGGAFKKQEYRSAAEGAFSEQQKAKIEGFWRDVYDLQADLGQTESERQLKAVQATGDEFAARVYAQTRDDAESRKQADEVVFAYRNALMEQYWRDEAARQNESVKAQEESAIKLLASDRERIEAQRKLNALRAAQAIDPTFDPTAPRTGNQPLGSAGRAYDSSLDVAAIENIANIADSLYDRFKNVATGALGSVVDAQNIQEAAKIMEEYGITLEQVSAIYGEAAATSGQYLNNVRAIAGAQDQGKAINTTTVAMKQLVKQTFASQQAFVGFGMAAGEALAGILTGSEDVGAGLKRFAFNLLGDLAIQFGTLAIAAGTAANAMPWFGLTGSAAIVAGIALVTLGSTLKALAGGAGGGTGGAETGGAAGAPADTGAAEQRERRVPRTPFNTTGEVGFAVEWSAAPGADGRLMRALMEELERAGFLNKRTSARGSTRDAVRRRTR